MLQLQHQPMLQLQRQPMHQLQRQPMHQPMHQLQGQPTPLLQDHVFVILLLTLQQEVIINTVKLHYVTFQGNSEIKSHNAGSRLIQVYLIWNELWREIKN